MKQLKVLLFLLLCLAATLQAQRRYFDPVFANVNVNANVTFGVNATVLLLQQAGQAIPQPLLMNVVTPAGDTATDRPLVIIMHTGNFLPPQVNGGCSGTINDATDTEIATRLAKMGYVVAVADYRLGWNPIAGTQTERVYTLINAAYRGVQDSRTCIRFFRKSLDGGNPYGIDPAKIVLWGIGTGGYISFASATLDTVTDTYIPKFVTPQGPMVIEPFSGNLNATTVGIYPGGFGLPYPAGDTLCYPNHVGYSSDFALGVNLGGALGDTSWIDANDVPFISFHTTNDPFAPCQTGIVYVPPPINLPVVEVTGSCGAQPIINGIGLNDAMINASLNDPLSQHAASINGNIEGFYPFFGQPVENSSPWGFSSSLEPYAVTGSNCDTAYWTSSRYFIDTVMTYFIPRACAVLGLDGNCQLSSSVKNLTTIEVGQSAVPNPADEQFRLQSDERFEMQNIELLDLSGRVCRSYYGVNTTGFTVNRNGLAPGIYFARVTYKEGIVTQKVVLR